MISNPTGKKLYLEIAREQPIIDYHCHLEAKAIWENEPFADITQLWLEGDHYKWRAMRANGIPEEKSPVTLPLKKNLRHGRKPLRPASVILSITGPIWNLNTILTLMTR